MCKILAFSNLKQVNRQELVRLIGAAARSVGKTERDGFGYAASGAQGVFGERGLCPMTFDSVLKMDKPKRYQKQTIQNSFGKYSKLCGPAIFHGRTSTNTKNIENTHPFVKDDSYLIHNGVISYDGVYEKKSTCDSEDLLEAYLLDKESLIGVETSVTGYYACAIIEDNHLRIFKDSIAHLKSAYVKSIDSMVFATNETIIKEVCATMRWKYGKIREVVDNSYFAIAHDNTEVFFKSIKPQEREYYYATQMSSKSLGYNYSGYSGYGKSYDDYDYTKPSASVTKIETTAKTDKPSYPKVDQKKSRRSHRWRDYSNEVVFEEDWYGVDYRQEEYEYVSKRDGVIITASDYGKLAIDDKINYERMVD